MGVRDAKYRVAKWKAKYESSGKTKGKKLSPEMEEKIRKTFTKQAGLENAIKAILSETGISTTWNIAYLAFGREINALTKRFSGEELNNKIESVMTKWLSRKLDRTILEKIKKLVLERKF